MTSSDKDFRWGRNATLSPPRGRPSAARPSDGPCPTPLACTGVPAPPKSPAHPSDPRSRQPPFPSRRGTPFPHSFLRAVARRWSPALAVSPKVPPAFSATLSPSPTPGGTFVSQVAKRGEIAPTVERGVARGVETGRPGLLAGPPEALGRSLAGARARRARGGGGAQPRAASSPAAASGPRGVRLARFAGFEPSSDLSYKLFLWTVSFVGVGRRGRAARTEGTGLVGFSRQHLLSCSLVR